ncbi:patatin-like protein [Tistrella bauzanensis]|uniref:Patatin-like protein n=1 Tax=Tistrella arctica TaxID=3133430 RepID=A0ABU9YI41_9PROT
MREIELRLAVVCFGGISLAVYIHGVSRELLALVRASERTARARRGQPPAPLDPTEQIYADLLNAIAAERPMRVVIDILAGASAGGVNAVTLARSLAHDLSLEPLRALWLDGADVDALTAERNRARPLSKLLLRPLLPLVRRLAMGHGAAAEAEFTDKLSRFLRARWFEPPFDGTALAGRFLDALAAQSPVRDAGVEPDHPGSLMPRGVPLDLIVTATDFYGHPRRVAVGDPAWVTERDHRHRLAFTYRRDGSGRVTDDFGAAGLPALAFAMRATSSFPGAFPPAHLGEIDAALRARGLHWPARGATVARCFADQIASGLDPERIWLIDGAVLDNKPFGAAIDRIALHPALRPVDRRLIYIDPHPHEVPPADLGDADNAAAAAAARTPGFLAALKASLSDIPRQEPIRDELESIAETNRRGAEVQDAVSRTWDRVRPRVHAVAGAALEPGSDAAAIGAARVAGHEAARQDAGFAYDAYLRLKLGREIDALARLLAQLAPGGGPQAGGGRDGGAGDDGGGGLSRLIPDLRRLAEAEGSVAFLRQFDTAYAARRLRFLLRVVNILADEPDPPPYEVVAALKADLYAMLGRIERGVCDMLSVDDPAAAELRAAVDGMRSADAVSTADAARAAASALALSDAVGALDARLAALDGDFGAACRKRLIAAYIGFAWIDVLLLPLSDPRQPDPSQTVGVMRISPDDALSLEPGGTAATLKGIGMQHFGAFFSRAWRENDYLWGRLHGAERMVDLLIDAATRAGVTTLPDPSRAKCRLFRAILEVEAPHLPQANALIRELRTRIDRIEDDRP